MKKKCDCYHTQRKLIYGYYPLDEGVCWGTKEKDPCSCDGDRAKCDFYPEVREKAIQEQKGSNCLIVTYDCCPPDTPTLCIARKKGNKVEVLNTIQGDEALYGYAWLTSNAIFKTSKNGEEKKYESWVITEKGCVITCPKCGERLELCYPDGTEVRYLSYCPWCGERLVEGDN